MICRLRRDAFLRSQNLQRVPNVEIRGARSVIGAAGFLNAASYMEFRARTDVEAWPRPPTPPRFVRRSPNVNERLFRAPRFTSSSCPPPSARATTTDPPDPPPPRPRAPPPSSRARRPPAARATRATCRGRGWPGMLRTSRLHTVPPTVPRTVASPPQPRLCIGGRCDGGLTALRGPPRPHQVCARPAQPRRSAAPRARATAGAEQPLRRG